MIKRIVCVTICLLSTASFAEAPSAYQCAPGTSKNGVGCTCPAGYIERRDNENTAICVRRAITITVKPDTRTNVPVTDAPMSDNFDAIDLTLIASKESCTGVACVKLAEKVAYGEGVIVDVAAAAKWYDVACSAGHARACYMLGRHYDEGSGIAIDPAKGKLLWQRSCDLGYALGCHTLALNDKDKAKVKALDDRTFLLSEAACNKQHRADACHDLASAYGSGTGVAKDERKAMDLYERGCKSGYGPSCHMLGWHFHFGHGTVKDTARATSLYEQACNAGGYHACSVLGTILDNPLRAGLGFAVGCRHGQAYGCLRLARWFADTDKSVLDRIQWKRPLTSALRDALVIEAYTLACTYSASSDACRELGDRYLTGQGVAVDKEKARVLFERACAGTSWLPVQNNTACSKARAP